MKTAFEVAVGVSYYVGKLWDIVTDPDIAEGRQPDDYTKTQVVRYGQPDENKVILSGNVPQEIISLLDKMSSSEQVRSQGLDDLTRGSLKNSLSTLHRILAKQDPAAGYITAFSNVLSPLKMEMPKIDALARQLGV